MAFLAAFGLTISFVLGGLIAGCLDLPDQPDYRNVLEKISVDINLQQLESILGEQFKCTLEKNPQGVDTQLGIWQLANQKICKWHQCLKAESYGDLWGHNFCFFFGKDDRLLKITASFPTWRLQDFPEPWKWIPKFASPEHR